ncbi:MAG: hypothetical protein JWR09_4709 [Mucilaginibacter sp.]|nr:hypothetical protein [Mucilaginibacter sp.]
MVYYVLILRKEGKGGVHWSFFFNNSKICDFIVIDAPLFVAIDAP